MNWDAIGAVGEIISALAVVVTLGYLALQIRGARAESEANAFTVTGGQRSDIRSRFMEHADVWAKGNCGTELSASERIVFDELVMSRADHHFSAFMRAGVRGSGREPIHVSSLALFLHQNPAAYTCWRIAEESLAQSRRHLSINVNHEWRRMVTEAVTALQSMEEPGA